VKRWWSAPLRAPALEFEDVLLALWVLGLERLIMWLAGGDPGTWIAGGPIRGAQWSAVAFGGAIANSPRTWLYALGDLGPVGWTIVGGLLFVIFTRGPEDRTLDDGLKRRILVTGPLYYFLAIAVAMYSSVAAGWRRNRAIEHGTPTAPPGEEDRYPGYFTHPFLRRAAVLPAALVGESAFRDHAQATLSNWLASSTPLPALFFDAAFLVGGFVFLVVGPRVAAGATTALLPWVLRFTLFAAAALSALQIA
jgi:hypothetical protein